MDFSIHNILRIKLLGKNASYVKYLTKVFHYFITNEKIENPDLVIDISEPRLDKDNYHIFNRKYWIKENYIYWKDRYKVVLWTASLKGIEESSTYLQFNSGRFGKILLLDLLIEPLINFKLIQKGFMLLHASGLSINNKGFIFPAYMGVGKTSTLLNLIEKGDFLANEKVILSSDGFIYGNPLPVDVYYYNIKVSPGFSKKININEYIELWLKYLIYKISLGYATFPLEIDPRCLWRIKDKCPLKSLFILTKTNREKIRIIEDCEKEEIIRRLIIITKFDMRYFNEILEAYNFFYETSLITNFWERIREILSKALKSATCYIIEIPYNYDFTTINSIYKLIQSNLEN